MMAISEGTPIACNAGPALRSAPSRMATGITASGFNRARAATMMPANPKPRSSDRGSIRPSTPATRIEPASPAEAPDMRNTLRIFCFTPMPA